jgi:hypothetical protein
MSEWYETFFDALAFDVWHRLMPADVSNAEATFLLHHLCGTDRLRADCSTFPAVTDGWHCASPPLRPAMTWSASTSPPWRSNASCSRRPPLDCPG